MLNWIWLGLVLGSIVYAAFTGRLEDLQTALFDSAKSAVTLVIGLVGVMVFFLGLLRIAFDGGLRDAIARLLAPLLRRLFPEVPPDHPAMSAMVMNMASNMFGMGNAATPFGLKAMVELGRLNRHSGSASNAMVLFLAINTSAITILPPLGTIGVRAAAGSADPFSIWIPTLIATTCSTTAAVLAYYALSRLPIFRQKDLPPEPEPAAATPPALDLPDVSVAEAGRPPMGNGRAALVGVVVLALGAALVLDFASLLGTGTLGDALKATARRWPLPLLIVGCLLVGVAGRVRVYDSMVEGAKEGLEVAARIVPYLVAILVAVGMFRASGALDDLLIPLLEPIMSPIGVPSEVLPMALLRPLSGSGAFGIMSEIVATHGPDSFIGLLTCTLQGSTETTFYVLALYLGAARIRDARHTLLACLTGDVAGFFGAVVACHWFFG
ncbi:MAG: spore maturation protein [Proteobacteria bacterium]|nr:spore maturation protein [Pseudomonadota bacterium]